jgi:hypothetical protein
MPMLTMRALVAFVHEGRAVDPGDLVQVAPVPAAVLRYQHRAEFVTTTVPPAPARKPRTYKRRDLRAES